VRCPYCTHPETEVIETRSKEDTCAVRRRRRCLKCGKRFTTYERVENLSLVVIKKNGEKEAFSREKLRLGIERACKKRLSEEEIDKLVDEIERNLLNRDTLEVTSKTIGDLVLKKLKKEDKLAYVLFASVYKSFEELEDLERELERLI
jgi:transcriptional repressor NrdR